MKISINISHLFSMIAIIVADVYLGFEYKGNVILIVSYTFLMLYIVLMVSVFSYNQRSNKYLLPVMNKFWGIISFFLGALLSDILKWGVALIKDDKLSVMYILICSPAIIELVGLVVSMVAFIFWPGYTVCINNNNNDKTNEDKETISVYKKHFKAKILLGCIKYNFDDNVLYINLNILYSSKRILTYENMDIAPALKQIVDKLEFIAKLNQKCNEIAVCCDLYAPELQVTYKFNKIKSYNNNIYYIKKIR